ncbi:phage holin family protein [Patescibacteria group bacterium]
MKLIIKILINALAFYILAYLVPGVEVGGYQSLLITAFVWGLVTTLIRPIIKILTFPISIVTLGLFTFVINAALLLLTARIVDGFLIDSFTTAVISAVALAVINGFLNLMIRD